MRPALIVSTILSGFFLGGCVERKLTVTSEPEGALVTLNNQEIGRTPVTRDFLWYGNYEVQLRREGFDTLKTSKKLIAPWWQWVPFDLVADIAPFRWTDDRSMHLTMQPTTQQATDSAAIMDRAAELGGQLQSSENTRTRAAATTKPSP